MLKIQNLPKSIRKQIGLKNTLPDLYKKASKCPNNMPEYEIFPMEKDSDILHIKVNTRPIPKGRPRIAIDDKMMMSALSMGMKGIHLFKKSVSLKTPKDTKDYESWIAHAGYMAIKNKESYNGYFTIHIDLYGLRQFSDIDNCMKSIMDGLNGIAYKDDKLVKQASITFHDGEPAVIIRVSKFIQEHS